MIKEVELKAHIDHIDQQIRSLELEKSLLWQKRETLLSRYQKVCSHTWVDLVSIYGYGAVRTCIKCGFEHRGG